MGAAEKVGGFTLEKAGSLWVAARSGLAPAPIKEEAPTPLRSIEEVETDLRAALEEFEVNGQFEVTSQATFSDKARALYDLTVEFIRVRSGDKESLVLKKKDPKVAIILPEDKETEADVSDFILKEVPKPRHTFYATLEPISGRVAVRTEDATPAVKVGQKELIPGSSTGYVFQIARQTEGSGLLYGSANEFETDGNKPRSNETTSFGALTSKNDVQTYASFFIQAVNDLLAEFGTPTPVKEDPAASVTSGS